MKETQTAIVDLEVFNEGLLRLQQLSGEVSFSKILPIVQALQKSIIPPPEKDRECPSPTPPKNSSKKSETNTK